MGSGLLGQASEAPLKLRVTKINVGAVLVPARLFGKETDGNKHCPYEFFNVRLIPRSVMLPELRSPDGESSPQEPRRTGGGEREDAADGERTVPEKPDKENESEDQCARRRKREEAREQHKKHSLDSFHSAARDV